MATAQFQDLIHSACAYRHYAEQSFREGFILAVKLGKELFDPEVVEGVGIGEDAAKVYRELASRFPNPESFTAETWEDLNGRWLGSTLRWMQLFDERSTPRKKWRLKNLLRREPLAMYAFLSLGRADQ